MTKTFVNKLVAYAKGLKTWEEIVSEGEGYNITADGRLVVDADHYSAKSAIDGITTGLCGLTALERRIEKILYFFYTKVTVEQIKEIAAREEVEENTEANEVKAVFVHSNAYDHVLVANGHDLVVDSEIMKDFLDSEADFGNWGSSEYWNEEVDIMQAAKEYGEVIAYISDRLVILDEKLFAERKEYYSAELVEYLIDEENTEANEVTNYVGKKIYEVANIEEVKNYVENEYGTLDYKIFRNIFNVPADRWVDGISNVCLEVDENGIITHQIENI